MLFIPIFVQLHYNTICILMEEMVFIWCLMKRVYLMKNISKRFFHNYLKKLLEIEITWKFLIKERVYILFILLFLYIYIYKVITLIFNLIVSDTPNVYKII